ncbi:merozoite surface protein 8, putative [Plasmodium knowlesi strain H]|uniref:Merozoite surface protein 8, putative n=4 Tax=Plasmodium knowlesi TaxID=5850 RepID=A0A5K1VN62_PLAKH|nr:merozoite surface protein 8, putative [Plasmodium knowlesi strain H]OTN67061.1 putative Merozoite Surface Protein 8 - MSP8 [Plasmodium knowlesi]CAA9988819.1 merozoite surface protein 8, putative [Plasmodium knowlesi strain H]SBO21824.1 merozoite surface protein 8, putative [Plasmodium knowlesi strain H]SBO22195.1 merozoite surface protein 8, putative [Plasmodium knowlesi strain H]VVS78293.1 merozoite surface protein 8, putative [Plasmodium knowlesi strain H]|eukprot:XP_002259798.1 Merozoite Surface Protein 8, MSP8, putative [Plasmodium knowlesi strain H]
MKKNAQIIIFFLFGLLSCTCGAEGNVNPPNNNGNKGNGNDNNVPTFIGGNNNNVNDNGDDIFNKNGKDVSRNDGNHAENPNDKKNENGSGSNEKNSVENADNGSGKSDANTNQNGEDANKVDEASLKKILKIVDEMENVQGLLEGDYSILDKYSVKLVDDDDGETNKKKMIGEYDLKMLKNILLFREKISRNCENKYITILPELLKKCSNVDDPKLSKASEKIKKGLTKNNISIEDFVISMLEDLFDKINEKFIKDYSFDLNDYLIDFELINYIIMQDTSDLINDLLNMLKSMNFKLESASLDKMVKNAQSGMNLNSKMKEDIIQLLKKSSAKFFKIEIDRKTKMIYPVQVTHKGATMKQFALNFLEKNNVCEHKKCPLNSNCYVIDGEEVCRCLPGFSDVKIDNVMNCVRDDTVDCNNNNGGCDVNATCTLIDKKIVCECKDNFQGDGIYCSYSIFNSINNFIFLILLLLCLYLF